MNIRSITLFGIGFVLLAAALFGGDSNDPKLSGIDVKFEDVDVKLLLSTKIATLYTNQLQESENPNCRAAAVLVAQEAVDKYSYWAKFVDLWKKVTDKVKDGADLVGAKTVSRVAQLAGTIVECFDDQEPAAAFGRAIVNEGADWLKDQIPKTKNESLDDAIKDQANKAKEKLSQALFPGKNEKAKDFQTPIGDCDVRVVPEFEWPGPKGKGGLRVFVDGDCKCKKPLKLAAHGAGTGQVVNSGLGQFKLIVFLPLEGMESDVSYGGKAINLKKYLETGSKLKKEIQNALNGKENKESPVDLAKELQDQTGKLTDGIKATLALRPVFEKQIRIEQLKIMSCDDCNKPKPPSGSGVTEQPSTPVEANADERNCDKRCGGLRETWDKAQTPYLKEKARNEKKTWDPEKKREMSAADQRQAEITSKKNWLGTVRDRLATAQKDLDAQKPGLEKQITEYQQRAQAITGDDRKVVAEMVQRLQGRLQALEQAVTTQKGSVERAEKDLADAEKADREAQGRLHDLEQKSDAARAAYYGCAKCCWDQAKAAKPDTKVPEDIEAWGKEYPINCCLVGSWLSESVVEAGKNQGGAGVALNIAADGLIKLTCDGMQAVKHSEVAGASHLWSGTSTSRLVTTERVVASDHGSLGVQGGDAAGLTHQYTYPSGQTIMTPTNLLGPIGSNLAIYSCNGDTLTLETNGRITTFKRQAMKVP